MYNFVLKYSNGTSVHRKCNMVGGLLSGAASIMSVQEQAAASNRANETNRTIARQNMDLQRETNAMNRDLQRETNEFNRDLYREQFNDQVDFWRLQNAYNEDLARRSPSIQMQGYRDAGINPALAMSKGSGTIGSMSAPTVPSVAPAQAPHDTAPQNTYHEEPFMYSMFGDAVSRSVGQTVNIMSQLEDIKAKQIDNATRGSMNQAQIDKMLAEKRALIAKEGLDNETKAKIAHDIARLEATFDSYVSEQGFNAMNAEITGQLMQEQMLNLAAERSNMEFNQVLSAQRLNMDMQQSKAMIMQIFRSMASMDVQDAESRSRAAKNYREIQSMDVQDENTRQDTKYKAQLAVSEAFKRQGIKLDNKQKQAFVNVVADMYVAQLQNLVNQNILDAPDVHFTNRYMNKINEHSFKGWRFEQLGDVVYELDRAGKAFPIKFGKR